MRIREKRITFQKSLINYQTFEVQKEQLFQLIKSCNKRQQLEIFKNDIFSNFLFSQPLMQICTQIIKVQTLLIFSFVEAASRSARIFSFLTFLGVSVPAALSASSTMDIPSAKNRSLKNNEN